MPTPFSNRRARPPPRRSCSPIEMLPPPPPPRLSPAPPSRWPPSPASPASACGAGQRRRQLGRARARLRPRGRDERLRRLRLRPPRQELPVHPRPRLHRHLRSGRSPARAWSASCSTSPAATSASAPPPAPAARRSTPTRNYLGPPLSGNAVGPPQLPPASRSPTAAASCAPPGQGRTTISGVGTYRGALETVPTESDAGSLNVVNALAVDQYVKGVIPNESPPSWPKEELKAQAIASRSFALTAGVGGNGFDLYADTRSQVYEGLKSEYARTNAMANATRGQVVEIPGQDRRDPLLRLLRRPHREHPERLRRPGDPLPAGRPRPLRRRLPAARTGRSTSAAPKSAPSSAPTWTAACKQVVVTKTGVSPRIISAKLIGTGGVTTVSGEQLEVALGGYATWMTFQKLSG